MTMLFVARPSIKKNLYNLDEYASDARTRSNGYDRVADELGVPVEFIRNAALREGLPSVMRLRTVLTPRQEEMFNWNTIHSFSFSWSVKYYCWKRWGPSSIFSSYNKHCDKWRCYWKWLKQGQTLYNLVGKKSSMN